MGNEPITEGLDFTIIRSVLNKFNTRNLLNFFSEKANSLLFVHYYEKNREEDAYGQSDVEPEKLLENASPIRRSKQIPATPARQVPALLRRSDVSPARIQFCRGGPLPLHFLNTVILLCKINFH